MQTFLPLKSFKKSAEALDLQRLSKQRVEAAKILSILLGLRWSQEYDRYVADEAPDLKIMSHPVVRMWSGHEGILYNYLRDMCEEYKSRGRIDVLGDVARVYLRPRIQEDAWTDPWWIEDGRLSASHRAVLLGKSPHHYSDQGWTETPAMQDPVTHRWPYFWPV